MMHGIMITITIFIQEVSQTEPFQAVRLFEENHPGGGRRRSGLFSGFYGTTERKYKQRLSFTGTFCTETNISVIKDEGQKDPLMV